MPQHLSQQRAPRKTEIPDKLYFRIGEVARLCAVAPYVLRFWESEFPQLHPNKSGTGQRLYRKRDVEMALRIKRLLYDEGYTIAGARQTIQSEMRGKSRQPELPLPAQHGARQTEAPIQAIRKELRGILAILSGPVAPAAPRQTKQSGASARPKPGLFES